MASTAPNSRDDAPFADRRAYPRVDVALPAFLTVNGERYAVQVIDISAGGAKVSCVVSLMAGTAIDLECGALHRTALVRWQNGGFLGISFERELEVSDVAGLAGRSKALAALIESRTKTA